jgi:hypothetical protein
MVMAQVLRGVNWKFVLCYDDILVFSENVEKHLDHLKQVFQRLQKANLALKPSRTCDNKGRSQSRSYKNISGYSTFPVPKTRNEVRSFLGMCKVMNAALCFVAGSIGICQNSEAKSRTEKKVAFAAPITSNMHSRRGNGKYTGFVILLSFL